MNGNGNMKTLTLHRTKSDQEIAEKHQISEK